MTLMFWRVGLFWRFILEMFGEGSRARLFRWVVVLGAGPEMNFWWRGTRAEKVGRSWGSL